MNKYYLTASILGSSLLLAGGALAGGPDCGKGGNGGATHFKQLDTNKDGKVTLAELTQSKEGWLSQVDVNKDGVASPAEIEASHQARHTERVERMFQRKDTNSDGRLTREESRMPEPRFAKADTNNDGALTQAELAQAPAQGQRDGATKHPGGRAGKGAHMDQNGDGKIEREEVRKAASHMLERLDRNSDGSLTAEELGNRGKRHGKGHPGPNPKG